jgi:predicted nuclease of predicted toxin-antitoxin system
MILWLDAQLPPSLAGWMKLNFNVTAVAVRDLQLRDATDTGIFHAARAAGATLLSKDSDFVDLVQRLGPPPQILWLTCGNASNRHLQSVLQSAFPKAKDLIEAGEPVVEIGDLS